MSVEDDIQAKDANEPDSIAMQKELADRLRVAIGGLPDQQASVFALHCFGEMDRAEIAATMGLTPNAVGVALSKARARLITLLRLEKSVSKADLTRSKNRSNNKGGTS